MGEDRRRRRIHKEQHDYVNRLRKYRDRGIPVLIDGKAICQESDWYKIFEVREDGAFYMADYVNTGKGILSEIHFDLVYLDADKRKAWEDKKHLEELCRRAQLQHYRSQLSAYPKKQEEENGDGRTEFESL